MYDYILVGAGLFNAVFAYMATQSGKKCLVVEKRNHIGGNCYTYIEDDIVVHKYGAHIFRTDDKKVWDFVNGFAEFNNFINSPVAIYKNEVYNMPFNMNTFSKMWSIKTPIEAEEIIREQSKEIIGKPRNLEEHAIKLVGRDVYEKLIKGYTEKQWGRVCSELPVSIMRRIPVRFTYDNNYFNSRYQGIPVGGYEPLIKKMFEGCDIELGVDFLEKKDEYINKAKKIVYTGAVDEFYEYCFGELEYRSLRFETEKIKSKNYQGVAVTNHTDIEPAYTRIIEHKHFEFGTQDSTIITKEYPLEWKKGIDPYYPINDEKNTLKYEKYRQRSMNEGKVIFGGRLGTYQYTDMQDTIKAAWKLWEEINE